MKTSFWRQCARLVMAGALVGGLSGCAPHDHGNHDHDGEPKTAQLTVFGERHEVFVEHRLVVAGRPTRFVTHVTDLKTQEPRREGTVHFHLKLGDEPPLERVENAPTLAGIYDAMLTFPKAGEWSISLIVPTEDGEKTIAFPSVKVFPDAHTVEHAETPPAPEGITFPKEQQWKVQVGTELATTRTLVEQLRLPAIVTARPGSLARVTPPLAGQLVLADGQPTPLVGDKVAKGQVLALLQPSFSEIGARLVEAEGEVVRTRLALEQATVTRDRLAKLVAVEARSGRELQEAEFALKTAQANYDAALALQATYRQATVSAGDQRPGSNLPAIELRSPISGIIVRQSGAAVGEFVSAENPLFTVLDAGTVFIEAQVPEAGVARLGATKAASYGLPGEPGRLFPITADGAGRLVSVGLQVDAATRTVPLIYEVKNPDQRLRVGQFLDLYVETNRAEDTLAVPDTAIVEEGGHPIAFVQVAGETFDKRYLTLGIRDGNWVQVLSGLAAGERVVTQGAYAIRLASMSSALPAHGHAH